MSRRRFVVNILVRQDAQDESPIVFNDISLPSDKPVSQIVGELFGTDLYSLIYDPRYKHRRYSIQLPNGSMVEKDVTLKDLSVNDNETLILTGHPDAIPNNPLTILPGRYASTSTKRGILYYPSISVPDGIWLRHSLLYWDEIGSIVPYTSETTFHHNGVVTHGSMFAEYSNDMMYLESAGLFRPFHPEAFINSENNQTEKTFERDFIASIQSPSFRNTLLNNGNLKQNLRFLRRSDIEFMRIHINKVSMSIIDYLVEEGLAAKHKRVNDWFYFEKNVALVYMALLARYLADIDPGLVVTGTDRPEYQNILYPNYQSNEGIVCLNVILKDALPMPRTDVSLSDIVKFKQKRAPELLAFRILVDEFHTRIRDCASIEQLKEYTARFRDDVAIGVGELEQMLKDARIATFLGSLETLIKLDVPTFVAAGAAALGYTRSVGELPLEILFSGLALTSSIKLSRYVVDRRNERTATLRRSAFSYLYLAKSDGLV